MSKHADGTVRYEYKGYTYCPYDDVEEDNLKRYHCVYLKEPMSDAGSVPLGPYASLSERMFQRWIDMGKPTREEIGGHQKKDHDDYYHKYIDSILLGQISE